MPGFSLDTVIARPAAEVFDLVADVSRNPEWCEGFAKAERTSTGAIGEGTTFATSMERVGDVEMQIVRYERPSHLRFRGEASNGAMYHDITFAQEGMGTRVHQSMDLQMKGVARWLAPLMALMLKRQVKSNTERLKQYLESGRAAAAGG